MKKLEKRKIPFCLETLASVKGRAFIVTIHPAFPAGIIIRKKAGKVGFRISWASIYRSAVQGGDEVFRIIRPKRTATVEAV